VSDTKSSTRREFASPKARGKFSFSRFLGAVDPSEAFDQATAQSGEWEAGGHNPSMAQGALALSSTTRQPPDEAVFLANVYSAPSRIRYSGTAGVVAPRSRTVDD
jgi:hypothetical protein